MMPNRLALKVAALVGGNPKDQVKWLYEALSVLDSKANGLLRINSLVMTIISLFLAYTHSGSRPMDVSRGFLFGCIVAFLLLTISSVICFLIVRMSWEFLAEVPAVAGTTEFASEIAALSRETTRRTHLFVNAWYLGLGGFALTMALAFGGVIVVLQSMF